jgi:hypothetical protein
MSLKQDRFRGFAEIGKSAVFSGVSGVGICPSGGRFRGDAAARVDPRRIGRATGQCFARIAPAPEALDSSLRRYDSKDRSRWIAVRQMASPGLVRWGTCGMFRRQFMVSSDRRRRSASSAAASTPDTRTPNARQVADRQVLTLLPRVADAHESPCFLRWKPVQKCTTPAESRSSVNQPGSASVAFTPRERRHHDQRTRNRCPRRETATDRPLGALPECNVTGRRTAPQPPTTRPPIPNREASMPNSRRIDRAGIRWR